MKRALTFSDHSFRNAVRSIARSTASVLRQLQPGWANYYSPRTNLFTACRSLFKRADLAQLAADYRCHRTSPRYGLLHVAARRAPFYRIRNSNARSDKRVFTKLSGHKCRAPSAFSRKQQQKQ
jgi:hypothetical protein